MDVTYTDIGRHILIVTKCVYLYQYKSKLLTLLSKIINFTK